MQTGAACPGTVPAEAERLARGRDARPRRFLGLEALDRQDPLQRGDDTRAELRPRRETELLERLGRRTRRAVDPRGQHRVERVRDVDDPRAERDLFAPEAVGVARAVEALVVVTDGGHGVVEEAKAVDDACALVGVLLHERPLLVGEARW